MWTSCNIGKSEKILAWFKPYLHSPFVCKDKATAMNVVANFML